MSEQNPKMRAALAAYFEDAAPDTIVTTQGQVRSVIAALRMTARRPTRLTLAKLTQAVEELLGEREIAHQAARLNLILEETMPSPIIKPNGEPSEL